MRQVITRAACRFWKLTFYCVFLNRRHTSMLNGRPMKCVKPRKWRLHLYTFEKRRSATLPNYCEIGAEIEKLFRSFWCRGKLQRKWFFGTSAERVFRYSEKLIIQFSGQRKILAFHSLCKLHFISLHELELENRILF